MAIQSNLPDDAANLRNALVEDLMEQAAIRSQVVRQAFRQVPRHSFVSRVDISTAYSNRPIFIRWDEGIPISSSTQPRMMAIMVEQLSLEPGLRVLEIGSGSGYNAAILAQIVGESGSVITVDIDQDIVDEAAGNLSNTGYSNVKCVCGDGFNGFSTAEPYDRIIVTVGAYDVSPHWVDQLKNGGILVVPLWFKGFNLCVALEKRDGELRGLSASPCMFIPIRGIWQRPEGYFPIGDPPNDFLQMTIGLEWDNQAHRRDLNRLFSQDVELRETGRSLEGQFHTQNLISGLYPFLTIDPRIFNVYSASQSSLFRGFGYGLIDLDTMSATVLTDKYPHQAVVYGNDSSYGQITKLLDQWDELGHLSIHDLHISAHFDPPKFIREGSWIIPKKSAYTWVLSWGS